MCNAATWKTPGLTLLLLLLCWPAVAPAAPATQPAAALRVLKQDCFACHNPEKHKGGLVLTSRAAALKGGENGPAVLPGDADGSPLVQVLAADADTHMPPKKQLAPDAVAALREWVSAGAPWDDRALADPAPPPATEVRFRTLPAAYRPVLALAVAPGDRTLAAGRGGRVFLHDLDKPGRPVARVLDGPRDAVQSLAWSPDGRRLAAGDYGRVLVWDLGDGAEAGGSPVVLEGLAGRVTAVLFLAAPDALVVADGGAGAPARLHLFRLPATRPAVTVDAAHADGVLSLARDRGGAVLASAGGDRVVKLWDPEAMKELGKLEGHTGRVASVAFGPDGKAVVSGGADRDVKVWDVRTRERKVTAGPHPAPVSAVAWVGEKGVAVACEDGSVRVGKADATELGRAFADAAGDVLYCLVATSDGKTLFAGCHDGHVYAWTAAGKGEGKLPVASPDPDKPAPPGE